jgi:hypothetical protein
MLTDFIKINPQTSEPQNYQKKNSSTFYDNSVNLPVPKIEVSLKKRQENLSDLLPILKNELKTCPYESITSEVKENASINGIKRSFKINGQIPSKYSSELNEFKNDLFSSLTNTNSFFDIDDNESWKIEETQAKGQKFESPNVFDIEGNETIIKLPQKDCIIFIYENNEQLNYLMDKMKKIPIIFVCKTNNFFQKKKDLIQNGKLYDYQHYFFSEDDQAFKNLKLPRIIIINEKGQIFDNRSLEKLNEIDSLENNLLYSPVEDVDNEYENLNSWWLNANNKIKMDVIYKINRQLDEAGFNNIDFEIDTSCKIDNKGIYAMRAIPIFTGCLPKNKEKDLKKFIDSTQEEGNFEKIKNSVNLI